VPRNGGREPSPTPRNFLEEWEITLEELNQIISYSRSLYGQMVGAIGEHKLEKMWLSRPEVADLIRPDPHDRTRKSDFEFTYRGVRITLQVKSLQSNSVRKVGETYHGGFQCDASDRREVVLPNGDRVETTCLVVGGFDLVAVNLFEFGKEWRFGFAPNRDLPRTTSRKYSAEQQRYLLKTIMKISWPLQPPYSAELFPLLDAILRERGR